MPAKYEEQQLALQAAYAYNFFEFTNVEQAAFTNLADMLTVAAARTSVTAGPQYAFERDRHYNDLNTCITGLGISAGTIAGANTAAAMQAVFATYDSNITGKESHRVHYVR